MNQKKTAKTGDDENKAKSSDEKKEESTKPRTQKNSDQKKALAFEFKADPSWSNHQCKRISQETGLSVAQVYKWGWDKKNRMSVTKQNQMNGGSQNMMMGIEAGAQDYMFGPVQGESFGYPLQMFDHPWMRMSFGPSFCKVGCYVLHKWS